MFLAILNDLSHKTLPETVLLGKSLESLQAISWWKQALSS